MTQCAYTHDVSNDRFPDLSAEWCCPHEAVAETEYCPFHLPSDHPQKSNVLSTLLDILRSSSTTRSTTEEKEVRRFIGADLPGLDLAYKAIENTSTYPIDLRDASVNGPIVLSHAHIEPQLWLDGAEIHGEIDGTAAQLEGGFRIIDAQIHGTVDFRDARFDHEFVLSKATIQGDIRLQDSQFEGGLRARETTFQGPVILHGATVNADIQFSESRFEAVANLERVTVADDAIFNRARLNQGLRLRQASMDAETTFTDATISGTATFTEARFDGDADFRTARFDDRTDFAQATFRDVSFSNASFHAPVRFDRVTARRVIFERCRFGAETTFKEAHVTDEALFDGISPSPRIHFENARFDGAISFTNLTTDHDGAIFDFSRANLASGEIAPGTEQRVVFDFARATIGNITLQTTDPTEHVSTPFDRYRFLRTEFDGFDFSEYSSGLKNAGWQLHSTWSSDHTQAAFDDPDYNDLEKTYLKAKNGAESVGATQAEAEFFRKQLIFRRKDYGQRLRSAPWDQKAGLFFRWISNWTFNITSGYGERPRYTVGMSVATIAVFALVFWGLLSEPPYGGTAFDYLFLSIEAFVSLIIGTPTIDSTAARFLAQLQGFFGGFLIALFVFTLTRSVYR